MRAADLEHLVSLVRGEYLEMPGLTLTREQAKRLWALDDSTCTTVLKLLVDRRFLVRDHGARYRRTADGRSSRAASPDAA